ncbi:hypothetical protein L1987_85753 [Smallanthus sonchifolius]|uniref:Uncharacterized protein n=1 Tax=Smallanthus sonchifolius TaxID=185202 RepID=A0ACB8XY22_9ASTR|nr:hypothetical protein L1987_85753 [Smallanthus sonchifolius]
MDKIVDEREPFMVPEDIETPYEHSKPTKKDWLTITEKPSIVERITHTIKNPEQALTVEILGWMYDDEKKMYVIKRGDGKIQYFDRSSKLKTLPYWDMRELIHLKMINPSKNTFAADFEEYLKKECGKDKFENFKPQVPECRKLIRNDKDGKRRFNCIHPSTVFDPVDLFSFSDEDSVQEHDV